MFKTAPTHYIGLACVFLLITQCGESPKKKHNYSVQTSKLEKSFLTAAKEFHIPVEILWAVGYSESRMIATPLPENEKGELRLDGRPLPRYSAFGLPFEVLDLDASNPRHQLLPNQVHAYARWLSERVDTSVSPTSKEPKDLARWILNVASVQYKEKVAQTLFAMRLRQVLGQGFAVHDPKNQDKKTVERKQELLDNEKLGQTISESFGIGFYLEQSPNDVYTASYLGLDKTVHHAKSVKQDPSGVHVVHCPFSLSTCVAFQSAADIHNRHDFIGAHYIIPPEDEAVAKPVQLLQHQYAAHSRIDDQERTHAGKVVVMLAGVSGKYSPDTRQQVRPAWLTHKSLFKLASVIKVVCDKIAYRQGISSEQCLSNTTFEVPTEKYQLGQVPDYDDAIFRHYLRHKGSSESVAILEPLAEEIGANTEFEIRASVSDQVSLVTIEQLFRCADANQLRWHTIAELPQNGAGQVRFPRKLLSPGPNGDGSHFFRIKTMQNQQLTGWDQLSTRIREPSPNSADASFYACQGL
ncbi:MAG: hypothetical protein OXT67_07990 [Zetaproteobacteria bacterium]|nr:hypothetical protein [Zetaproteobacteria bacterium]